MPEQVNVTQSQPVPPARGPRTGPSVWMVLGIIVGAIVVLLLLWMFWLQPTFYPQVQVLSIPQTSVPQPTTSTNVNVQGGSGGQGGTRSGGAGGTGGGGAGGTGGSGGSGGTGGTGGTGGGGGGGGTGGGVTTPPTSTYTTP